MVNLLGQKWTEWVIFVNADRQAKLLTPDRMSACSPRFLPDGSKLVFLSNEPAAQTMTHMGTAELLTLDWPGMGRNVLGISMPVPPPPPPPHFKLQELSCCHRSHSA